MNVDGDTWVAYSAGSSGVINFDNGTLNTGGLFSSPSNLQGTGTINTNGLVSDINLIFDRLSSLSQSFTLDDPGQNISLNLEVDGTGSIGAGYDRTGQLHISGGVKVESIFGYLGHKAGSSGTAFVVGEGSEWNNSEQLYVGRYGNGTLNIMAGGVVSNTYGRIGLSSGSVGTVTVTGDGSEWNNSSDLYVGYSAEGTLNIMAGGVVSNSDGYIGSLAGSVGTVTVTGEGSEWNNSGRFYVGDNGTATLNIESGGVVSTGYARIGHQSSSMGTVTVTGEGSQWNSRSLLVGYSDLVSHSGEGTINIESGGVVNVAGNTRLNNSTLHIELSDPTSGPSLITGELVLENQYAYHVNTLEISLADGFVPELGNTFDILDFNTVRFVSPTALGNFAEMNLPALEDGLLWDSSQLLVDGTICVGACIPLASFTKGSGADHVPEPTTLLLALLALTAVPLRVRHG